MCVEAAFKEFIDDEASVWKAVHAKDDLDVDAVARCKEVTDLYSMMISSGMSWMLMWVYSSCARGVLRLKFEVSMDINRVPMVKMMLLKRILAVSMSAVGVATSQG